MLSLVLIAQAIFLLERAHTQSDATDHPTHASATSSVDNYRKICSESRKSQIGVSGNRHVVDRDDCVTVND